MASPFLLPALLLLLFSIATAAPENRLVTHLPGFHGAFPSKHYSGYITVDDTNVRRLFYYLVLSECDPAADAVVLWLNGGPGCSSFDGFVYENGPFNFEPGSAPGGLPKLQLNPYSWSKVSNVIYLDSPAGVGMSYSLNKSDYTTGTQKALKRRINLKDVSAACHGTFCGKVDDVCQEKIDRVRWELKDLNKYNILAPCYHHPEIQEVVFMNTSLPSSFRKLGETDRPFPVRKRMAGRSWPLRVAVSNGGVPMWPQLGGRSLPCTVCKLEQYP